MDRFRVAILGTGFGRLVQAVGFQRHPDFELVAIAGSDAEKTRRIAGELGIAESSGDWRDLLDRVRPDLVSIVTPVDLHHPMMLAALAGGAHVLCEKPTALHRFQAAEMRDLAATQCRLVTRMHHRQRPVRLCSAGSRARASTASKKASLPASRIAPMRCLRGT